MKKFSSLFFKSIFIGYGKIGFFFWYFKDVFLLSYCFHSFQWKICCHPYLRSTVHMWQFFSVLSDSLFISDLSNLVMTYVGVIFFHCVCWCNFLHVPCAWGSLSFLDLKAYSFYQIWNIFLLLFYQICFQCPPIYSLRNSNCVYIGLPDMVLWLSNTLFFILFSFFLLFHFANLVFLCLQYFFYNV